jgi:Copper type II ascorbate-dependent monooxygenase, C-terminal domain
LRCAHPCDSFVIADNPGLLPSEVDNSGIRLYLDNQNVRPNQAGFMFLGMNSPSIFIPPGQDYHHQGGACDTTGVPSNLNFFAWGPHMHLVGKQAWLEVERASTQIYEAKDLYFDFAAQTFRPLNWVIQPGDKVKAHCVWDSSNELNPTYGGDETNNEMCLLGMLASFDPMELLTPLSPGFSSSVQLFSTIRSFLASGRARLRSGVAVAATTSGEIAPLLRVSPSRPTARRNRLVAPAPRRRAVAGATARRFRAACRTSQRSSPVAVSSVVPGWTRAQELAAPSREPRVHRGTRTVRRVRPLRAVRGARIVSFLTLRSASAWELPLVWHPRAPLFRASRSTARRARLDETHPVPPKFIYPFKYLMLGCALTAANIRNMRLVLRTVCPRKFVTHWAGVKVDFPPPQTLILCASILASHIDRNNERYRHVFKSVPRGFLSLRKPRRIFPHATAKRKLSPQKKFNPRRKNKVCFFSLLFLPFSPCFSLLQKCVAARAVWDRNAFQKETGDTKSLGFSLESFSFFLNHFLLFESIFCPLPFGV